MKNTKISHLWGVSLSEINKRNFSIFLKLYSLHFFVRTIGMGKILKVKPLNLKRKRRKIKKVFKEDESGGNSGDEGNEIRIDDI